MPASNFENDRQKNRSLVMQAKDLFTVMEIIIIKRIKK